MMKAILSVTGILPAICLLGLAGRAIPAEAPEGFSPSVPLLYEPAGNLSPLTEYQKYQLEKIAKALLPGRGDIWFAVVTDSHVLPGDQRTFSATVYYTPHSRAGRYWEGKLAYLMSVPTAGTVRLRKEQMMGDYVQLWPTNSPPRSEKAVPPIEIIPFTVEGDLRPDELAALVDRVRLELKPQDGPVVEVRSEGDTVTVRAAASRRRVAGRSVTVTLEREGGQWTVKRTQRFRL